MVSCGSWECAWITLIGMWIGIMGSSLGLGFSFWTLEKKIICDIIAMIKFTSARPPAGCMATVRVGVDRGGRARGGVMVLYHELASLASASALCDLAADAACAVSRYVFTVV